MTVLHPEGADMLDRPGLWVLETPPQTDTPAITKLPGGLGENEEPAVLFVLKETWCLACGFDANFMRGFLFF